MSCVMCGSDAMKSERRNVPYRSLPGTVLTDVEVWTCSECGEQEVVLPSINELERVLARAVARMPGRLSSEEIRFLRKHLGWSGADFASHFGVQPETVSRWENGTSMGAQAERLLRVCATRMDPIEDYAELEALLDEPAGQRPAEPLRIRHEGDRWVAA